MPQLAGRRSLGDNEMLVAVPSSRSLSGTIAQIAPERKVEFLQVGASQRPSEDRVSIWINSDQAPSSVLAVFMLVISRLSPERRAAVEPFAMQSRNLSSRVMR